MKDEVRGREGSDYTVLCKLESKCDRDPLDFFIKQGMI